MVKKFFLLFFIVSFQIVHAQFIELAAFGGAANYDGDLSTSDIGKRIGSSNLAVGVSLSYGLNRFIQIKGQVASLTISASDKDAAKMANADRNLSFRSKLTEGSVLLQYNILGYDPESKYMFSPYIYSGIAYFHFNPKAEYNNEWYALQPLGTEGQHLAQYPERTPYKLNQVSIPFGFGVRYAFNENLGVYIDLGTRKTFTDYLDDVSTSYVSYGELLEGSGELAAALANRRGELTGLGPDLGSAGTPRGNPGSKDWYLFGGVGISYVFGDISGGFSGPNRRNRGCPTF